MTNNNKFVTIVNKLCKGCGIVTQKELVESYIKELDRFYKHYVATGTKYGEKYKKIQRKQGEKEVNESHMIDAIFEYDSVGLERIIRYNDLEDQYYDSANHRTVFASVLLGMQYEGTTKRNTLLNKDLARIKLRLASKIEYIKEILALRKTGMIEEPNSSSDFRSRIRVPQNQLNHDTNGNTEIKNTRTRAYYEIAK